VIQDFYFVRVNNLVVNAPVMQVSTLKFASRARHRVGLKLNSATRVPIALQRFSVCDGGDAKSGSPGYVTVWPIDRICDGRSP